MQLTKGNRAIAEHSAAGKGLLLFRKTATGLRFEGEMVYDGHHIERAPDRNGNERDAIVFELRALDAVAQTVETTSVSPTASLDELRQRALAAAGVRTASSSTRPRNVYERSADVRTYVLARADGNCEGCSVGAPFRRPDGTPYLEPHHLRRVSDGGPDHPAHVIALCPNCHRRVHAGADAQNYNQSLAAKMQTIEREVLGVP